MFPKERPEETHYTDATGVKGCTGCRECLEMAQDNGTILPLKVALS